MEVSLVFEWLLQWMPTLLTGAALLVAGSYFFRKCSLCTGGPGCCVSASATLDEGKEKAIVNDLNPPQEKLPRFTLEELQKCNGKNGSRLFVGIQGLVYDVGAHEGGRKFYGQGGSYNLFAGRDATTALAKMALDESLLNSSPTTWESFSEEERVCIVQWAQRFCSKYSLAGVIDFGPAGNEAASKWRAKAAKA